MMLLFADTETTGKDEQDRLIQVAYRLDEGALPNSEYFKPPVPISYEAMAVHHITNEMVADKPTFGESKLKAILLENVNRAIFVAHNAPFDLKMLEKEGVKFPIWIDTLRVARHLIDSPNYSLQYLRYSLNLKFSAITPIIAHDASGDVMVLMALFESLMGKMLIESEYKSPALAINKMVTLSSLPVLMKTLPFGKYYGKSFEEVSRIDRQYLAWLFGQEKAKDEANRNEDLLFTLKHYLQ